ncbi:hypothetical protein [Nonomuraea roseoviolacea]|uniref:Uncharacterized protein n=1 Tax=Nonomuraea roseoviolacea subsp. carminata TaxID=160689 RepID=A0ABT1JVU8_9ACTN|nr:hypothetical protein [Nonomuraea roseoviolacea]MCP2345883.1 hypothetical protein [Nonomuraea roseoviolacea subsp. carminata]
MNPLEARYRRLLACYPRDHRARHEDEMIGVLLAGARPGQTWPPPADVADLLWGALRVHGRRAFGPVSAAAALPVLAVSLGRRWIALLGVVAFVLYATRHPYLLDLDTLMAPNHGPVLLAETAAPVIAFLPAAYRAIRLVPWRAFLVWGPLAVAGLTAAKGIVRWVDVPLHQDVAAWKAVPWLVVVAPAAGFACRSAVGRRAALILFLPAAALGDLGDLPFVPASTALAQLGCAALAFTAAAVLTHRRRGPVAPAG